MDAAEFDEFYAETAPRLVGQLTVMLGSFTEAQDCVQEAFVRAWLHRKELSGDGHPEAWVRRTAWRVGVSRWRSLTATLRAYGRRGTDPHVPAPLEDHAVLMAALRQINADQRRAIVLHHLCDLSVGDVAAEVGAPVGTVKARLARGRQELARILGLDAQSDHGDNRGEPRHA